MGHDLKALQEVSAQDMTFRVVIEATPVMPKPSGVGLYVINLIEALYELQSLEQFQLGLAYQPSLKNWLRRDRTLPECLRVYPDLQFVPLPVRILNILAKVPTNPILNRLENQFGAPNIYHGTNYAVFPCQRSLRVMNIYDLSFIRYPDYVTSVVRTYTARIKQCLQWADLVLTISESSKQDIIEFLKVPAERIWVTPLASRYSGQATISQVSKGKSEGDAGASALLDKPHILFVSTLEPRKNVIGLITAFNQLKSELRVDHHLVLAGQKGWKYEPILAAIEASPWKDFIHHLNYVSDAMAAELYTHAEVFAYPSFYEGFGLPVLEAMTLGCPVVTSNTSSLPEVAGDAALMVNPHNSEEIAEALGKVICDRTLRQTLIDRGRARAALFSWKHTALDTLQAYRSIL